MSVSHMQYTIRVELTIDSSNIENIHNIHVKHGHSMAPTSELGTVSRGQSPYRLLFVVQIAQDRTVCSQFAGSACHQITRLSASIPSSCLAYASKTLLVGFSRWDGQSTPQRCGLALASIPFKRNIQYSVKNCSIRHSVAVSNHFQPNSHTEQRNTAQ